MAVLCQVLKFKHCTEEQALCALHIWWIRDTSQAPVLSTKMLLSQQKYTLRDSTSHSIGFAILNCTHIQHHGAAEHQDMVFTLESVSERFTLVALPEESRTVRFDPIAWAAEELWADPWRVNDRSHEKARKMAMCHKALSCDPLENETNYSDMLIMITPEIVLIRQSCERSDMCPKLFVPSISHPT